MGVLDALVERRIAQAIAEGALDDLPGAGKPLILDDDRMIPEDLRVASALPLIVRKNRRGTRKFGISDFEYDSPHLHVSMVHGDRRSPCTIRLERNPLESHV